MTFVQIIEYTTSRIDEVMALAQEWEESAGGASSVTRLTATVDLDRPNTYLTIVEFPSYEQAMANSSDSKTDEFARRMQELCDGPTLFRNLDVKQQILQMPQRNTQGAHAD